MRKLTLKQQMFADNFIVTGNATESAIRAGYSRNSAKETGYENLTKPHIKRYIDKRVEKIVNDKIADQKEVLERLTSIMRGEVKEAALVWNRGVQEVIYLPPSNAIRIKAAELIGRRYGLWSGNIEVKQQVVIIMGEDGLED